MYEDTGGAPPKASLDSECHGLYSSRTRNTVNKIHKAKTQDHLGNHQAIRRVTGKPEKNTVDYRISGAPLSAVEQQDTTREKTRSRS